MTTHDERHATRTFPESGAILEVSGRSWFDSFTGREFELESAAVVGIDDPFALRDTLRDLKIDAPRLLAALDKLEEGLADQPFEDWSEEIRKDLDAVADQLERGDWYEALFS